MIDELGKSAISNNIHPKIITWNINQNQEAFNYITGLVKKDPNLIICLQEVLKKFTKKINESEFKDNYEFKNNIGIAERGIDIKEWGTFIMWGKNYKGLKLDLFNYDEYNTKQLNENKLGIRHTPFIKLEHNNGKGTINVMSVHLPNINNNETYKEKEGDPGRTRKITEQKSVITLIKILEDIKDKTETYIVAGDFNLTPVQINQLDDKYKKYFKKQINPVQPLVFGAESALTIELDTLGTLGTLGEKQGLPEPDSQKKQITCSRDKLNNLVENNITAWGWGKTKEEKRQNKIKFCDRLDYIISNKDIFTGNNVPTIQDNNKLKMFYNKFNYKPTSDTDDNHAFVDHAPVATFTVPEYTFMDWLKIIGVIAVIFGLIYITLYPDSELAKLINSYGNNQYDYGQYDEQYGGQSNRYVKCRKDYIALKYM